MQIIVEKLTSVELARLACQFTTHRHESSTISLHDLYACEHSPIRTQIFLVHMLEIPTAVSVHFVRHKIGIEHFVSTQRTDRTGVDRTDMPQSAPVDHECFANAQAVIFISRKRLCRQASPETTAAWTLVLDEIKRSEPELFSVCVPECVYRGFCPEFKCCGYAKTDAYQAALAAYRAL